MSDSTRIAKALQTIAEVGSDPTRSRFNGVPWLLAHRDVQHGWVLSLNVVHDPRDIFGAALVAAYAADKQLWWNAAKIVQRVEDIPKIVGELYAAVTAKLLEA